MVFSIIWLGSEKLTKEGVFSENLSSRPSDMPVYIAILNHPEEPFIIFILFLGTASLDS